METDREVLIWFHDRLVHVHKESELMDYMHRLRYIIKGTPKNRTTRKGCANGMDELRKQLKIAPGRLS